MGVSTLWHHMNQAFNHIKALLHNLLWTEFFRQQEVLCDFKSILQRPTGCFVKKKKKVMEPTAARGAWVRPLPVSQSVSRGVMVNVALKTAKVHSRI